MKLSLPDPVRFTQALYAPWEAPASRAADRPVRERAGVEAVLENGAWWGRVTHAA